ncbi:MAG TPA: DnaA N-terminal domain-containing protein, partial [Anaerolineales bacterium]|nr:DnaA N-terminal domain-containing protein [Anaerolineales bacterium]
MHDQENMLRSSNNSGSLRDPSSAWQSVLDQLQQEMGKATYDTWVRGAVLERYQDGAFVIGVENAAARDWLESRLTTTITRQLVGLMNRTVDVRFILSQAGGSIAPQEETQSLENPIGNTADDSLVFSIDRELLQAYTKPDAALYFETYWLRWVPYIGAGPFLTVLAFRQ